ncbi:uncharacterized protein TRIADDRAFT_21462 [Trichoplax adhaerens]|uniref:Alpha-1,3-mannosyl-glycoprotein 2-beta-N-acetylglucosaminyltransferase n=1 Tax=Trichoplax adhaerens TaxID=10228 RepID=B3RNX5_TRIAD|nr:hypothetical protein TRIADDRAFT_21462 [Trichoplax adhaerens]EDV27534.1 hypothetical protein TRIADDRAFT_21462 [Trichoplax adhaerens]|eukprot:XP_002109368.1 hypothetical protein TRIADDRAFT_21462 [Trichoplax adhaerens]
MLIRKSSRRHCYFLINWLLSFTVIILLSINLYVTLYGSPFKASDGSGKFPIDDNINLKVTTQPVQSKSLISPSKRTNNHNQKNPHPSTVHSCNIPYECKDNDLALSITSGPRHDSARICVNGKYYIDAKSSTRGFNVVVINPATKLVVDSLAFDIYAGQSGALVDYINKVTPGHFLAMATADDAFFRISEEVKHAIEQLGSVTIHTLNFRSSWVFVGRKGSKGATLLEEISHGLRYRSGGPKSIATCIPIDIDMKMTNISFFCENHSEFDVLCKKKTVFIPPRIGTGPVKASAKPAYKLPIAIIAGNRPFYLQRCLESLLRVPNIDRSLITIFLDGFVRTPAWIANLYGIRVIVYPKSTTTSKKSLKLRKFDQIAVHYRRSLGTLWDIYPQKSSTIILEEDLVVSPDILDYFSESLPCLKADNSILTISAWNPNGYRSSSFNTSLLYRSDFFSGMGWILTRKLWNEIAPKWPSCCRGVNWDDWLRLSQQRRGRDTIYPDVSRIYHIGAEGVNNENFHKLHYKNQILNTIIGAKLRNVNSVIKAEYDKEIERILKIATPIRYSRSKKKNVCGPSMIPNTSGKNYAIYFYQSSLNDYKFGKELCACFQLWDSGGIRGLYSGIFRFYNKKNHVIAVGSLSKFAKRFMPKRYSSDWLSETATKSKKPS